ncbi:hypothetical protein [Rhodoferax sp.]|uniref:hypothetical protein n=1 Tax=Rhodoferax sp. TaxID=50421 RepID=UPI0025E59F0B|nr:hypothetical protein [Rhodoferax sp.]
MISVSLLREVKKLAKNFVMSQCYGLLMALHRGVGQGVKVVTKDVWVADPEVMQPSAGEAGVAIERQEAPTLYLHHGLVLRQKFSVLLVVVALFL